MNAFFFLPWALNQRTDNFLSAVGGRGAGSPVSRSPHRGRVSLLGAPAVGLRAPRQSFARVRVRAIPVLVNTHTHQKNKIYKKGGGREGRTGKEGKGEQRASPSFLPGGSCQTTPKLRGSGAQSPTPSSEASLCPPSEPLHLAEEAALSAAVSHERGNPFLAWSDGSAGSLLEPHGFGFVCWFVCFCI